MEAFFAAVLKLTIPLAIEEIRKFFIPGRGGRGNRDPYPENLGTLTLEELGAWYARLYPPLRAELLQGLERCMTAT